MKGKVEPQFKSDLFTEPATFEIRFIEDNDNIFSYLSSLGEDIFRKTRKKNVNKMMNL